jgi:hypothetical protein
MDPEAFDLWVVAERIHDGAQVYFSHPVRDDFNDCSHDQWIGRRGSIACPPRSPDVNTQDIYLWGHLKTFVNAALVDSEEALHNHIVDACRHISSSLASFYGFCGPWLDGSRRKFDLIEDIFSTYYKRNVSSVTHKITCFYTYNGMDIFLCFDKWNSCQIFVRNFLLLPITKQTKTNPMAWVFEWTIPTEWTQLIGEFDAKFCG